VRNCSPSLFLEPLGRPFGLPEFRHQLNHEYDAVREGDGLRRERAQAYEQLKQTHAQQLEVLRQQIAGQQRELDRFEQILRTLAQSVTNSEMYENFAAGLRAIHEDILLRR
jgi:hypothetical protein